MELLTATPEWLAYSSSPTGSTLHAVLRATPIGGRRALTQAVEDLFFLQGNWRVAQHAALLHLDRFEPQTESLDLVKALCFAEKACELSANDPRARLLLARVSWERRLPLAVLHDVEQAHAGESRLLAEIDERLAAKVLGEAFLLEGLARAYLRDVRTAHEKLVVAGERGCLTVEALIQLLLAAEAEFPEEALWAVSFLPEGTELRGRAGALHHRVERRQLLRLLQRRMSDGRE